MEKILAIDIGGTEIKFAVGSDEGLESDIHSVSSDEIDSVNDLIEVSRGFLERQEVDELSSVSVVSAGIINREKKEVVKAAHVEEMDLKPIGDEFGCRVYLENDANAAALGEKFFNFSDTGNLVYLVMGSGIGAGVMLDDDLLISGSEGGFAETGFSVINYSGEKEHFDRKGVWEAYSSGANLSRHFEEFSGKEGFEPSEIFNLAEDGDEQASRFIEKVGRINAAGFATLINNFNPEVIVVGGSLPQENPDFFGEMKNILHKEIRDFIVNPMPQIELTKLERPELYGAIANALGNSSA